MRQLLPRWMRHRKEAAMPHSERPKVPKKGEVCPHCGNYVWSNEKAYRLTNDRVVHDVCYLPYRREHPTPRPAA